LTYELLFASLSAELHSCSLGSWRREATVQERSPSIVNAGVDRKARGAFFTPPAIADFLASWAVHRNPNAHVLDPTCGEAVFLLAAARRLRALGCDQSRLDQQVFGIDLHRPSLDESMRLLEADGLDAHLIADDVFAVPTPDQLGCPIPHMDAVIGNPPFVRYQEHRGATRQRSTTAALRRGVRLSGLASSWAAVLVHADAFLKPGGRLAMVLPAELLTVHYAEPVRRWLRERFGGVTLVMFDRLQFDDALERVVLVLAHDSGGCDSFSLVYVHDADELVDLHVADGVNAIPASEGKWTSLLLPLRQRQLYKRVTQDGFVPLSAYGRPELGTVTGGNSFFALTEETRLAYGLDETQVRPICPPGSRHLKGLSFGIRQWTELRDAGERVWLLQPDPDDDSSALARYVRHGEGMGVDEAYKCQIRSPWWRPPMVSAPDLFFTYMSHRYPRLVANTAGVSFLNSMHGLRLERGVSKTARAALPLLSLNSVSMLGAEVHGRSYGGGVLKMEPREAALLPVPRPDELLRAWAVLRNERDRLGRQLQQGLWTNVTKRIDDVLLQQTMGLSGEEAAELHEAAASLRERRMGQ
jgi:adenine-specific DNA methylase